MVIIKKILAVQALGTLLALSACSLAPDYARPDMPVPKAVDYSQAAQNPAGSVTADTGWRDFFKDARLQRHIATALENNRDLRLAVLKVAEARAQYGVQNADRFPQLGADGSGTYEGGQHTDTTRSFSANLGMTSFDLDLFGKLKNQSASAFQAYLGTEEGRRAAQISLVSQVAQSYLAERLAVEKLALARQTVNSRRQSLAFIEQRVTSGQSTLLELEQARSMVESAQASLEGTQRERDLASNTLKQLTGRYDPAEDAAATPLLSQSFTALPANVPSAVLLQRPDVMQAEHALMAANADIGAARAAFFPSITLTGSTGYSSNDFEFLFAGVNSLWSFMPKITLPIFEGGRNVRNLELAEIRKESSVVEYEKAIQTAFKEVADALASRPTFARQLEAQARYLKSQRLVLELAESRYASGSVSYLEVLDAQRNVFQAEQDTLTLRQQQLVNDINLYAALGGGLKEQSTQTSLYASGGPGSARHPQGD